MEMHTLSKCATEFDNLKLSLLESAIHADKSLRFLLLLVWFSTNKYNVLPNSVRTDQRFPISDLNKVKEPDAENNDAGEAADDKDSDDEEDNDEDDGNDSQEDSDDDDELEAAGYGDGDDDDDDDDNDDDEDEDEDDDSDEDDESDEDEDEDEDDDDSEDEDDKEQFKLPSQRKK